LDRNKRRVLLVRHCDVEDRYRQVCYGRADVSLSELGLHMSRELARQLASEPITQVWHSGLARTRVLAEALAALVGVPAWVCPSLRERDFGSWELRTWEEIYLETGDAMLGTVLEPTAWRPPGGKTTFEMRDRVLAWFRALPSSGVIVAVTHGGPIAALRGVLLGRAVTDWPELVPATGVIVEV
jgi:broad specificity phosphatase PhoE